jgi:predicted nucleotidyltransferase
VTRLEVFGSAARGADFDPARSDMDFLVTFALSPVADDVRRHLDLANALESLLGRSVDLVERQSVETSRNYIRRRAILGEATPIFGGSADTRALASSKG